MMAQASQLKTPGKIFSVAVIGASEKDLEILGRVFGVTRYRQRSYKLHAIEDVASTDDLANATADIFILNVNNPKAVVCWHKYAAGIEADQRKPIFKLSHKETAARAASDFTIPWPINPAKLLQTLDEFTIRYLHYYPEFEIGSDVEPTSAVVHNFKTIATTTQQRPEGSKNQAVRVLVADDSLAVRRQLKIEFDSMDAQLNSVADGEAAVKAAEEEKYDVIFLDVVMPGMDGYTVCKNIRKSRLNKTTPVIMLTSRSSKFDKLKGILAGCDTYLTKPINHNEFKDITQKHLGKKMEK